MNMSKNPNPDEAYRHFMETLCELAGGDKYVAEVLAEGFRLAMSRDNGVELPETGIIPLPNGRFGHCVGGKRKPSMTELCRIVAVCVVAYGAQAAAIVAESWMVFNRLLKPGERPSSCPDRQEGVLITAQGTGGKEVKVFIRIEQGRAVPPLIPLPSESGLQFGRFGRFVPLSPPSAVDRTAAQALLKRLQEDPGYMSFGPADLAELAKYNPQANVPIW